MELSRDSYINNPSPIEKELKILFNNHEQLTIFDIGSCEGLDSIKYSRLFPNAKIYAVEALPKNLALIQENLEKYSLKNVEILPIALSDQKGKAQFFVSSGHPDYLKRTKEWDYGNKSSSLLAPDQSPEFHPWLKFNETILVDTDTLDNVCEEHHIEKIDFIHMDVQGAELKVLQGAKRNMIKNTTVIWLEVEAVSLYQYQPLKPEIENFMKENNFYKLKDTVDKVSGDQLWLNLRYLVTPIFPDFSWLFLKTMYDIKKYIKYIKYIKV